MSEKLENVVLIDWLESERGWGIRPDGCSLHLNEEDAKEYVKDYWARMPKEVPHEYSRPTNEKIIPVKVSEDLYNPIVESKNGIRLWRYSLNDETKEVTRRS